MDKFFEMLYSELKNKLPKGARIEQVRDYETFADMVKTLDDLDYKLILLLDEFDKILQNKNFEEDFFSYLRSIANRYDFALIVSTKEDLEGLSRPDLLGSPFFNIFDRIRLGLFQREEAQDLITSPSAEEGIPLEEDTEFILKNAGLSPFFIQLLCYELLDYRKNHDNKIDQEGYNEVLEKFWEKATPHFNHSWKGLSQEEKDELIKVTMGKEVTNGKKSVIGGLKQKGYITAVNGKNQIFGDTFQQFVLDHQEEITDINEIKRKPPMTVSDILTYLVLISIIALLGVSSYLTLPRPQGIILGLTAAMMIGMILFLLLRRGR